MSFGNYVIITILQALLTTYFVNDVSAADVRDFNRYNPKEFQQAVLAEVNKRRARHQVPPLYLSDEVNNPFAQFFKTSTN